MNYCRPLFIFYIVFKHLFLPTIITYGQCFYVTNSQMLWSYTLVVADLIRLTLWSALRSSWWLAEELVKISTPSRPIWIWGLRKEKTLSHQELQGFRQHPCNPHTVFCFSTFWGSRAPGMSQCRCRCPLWTAHSHRMGLCPDEHKETGLNNNDPIFTSLSWT